MGENAKPTNDSDSKLPTSKSPDKHQNIRYRSVPLKTCRNCGSVWKWTHYCPAEGEICKSCGKNGHYARMCFYSNKHKNPQKTDRESTSDKSRNKDGRNSSNKNRRNFKNNINNNQTTKSDEAARIIGQGDNCPQNSSNSQKKNNNPRKPKQRTKHDKKKCGKENAEEDSNIQPETSEHSEKHSPDVDTNVGSDPGNDSQEKESANESQKETSSNNDDNGGSTKSDDGKKKSAPGCYYQEQKEADAIDFKQKLAKSFYEMGNYEAALSHYSRLIEVYPNEPKNFNNRSACYMMLGQYENCLGDANRVIQMDPSCVKAYVRAIKCAIFIGSTASAEFHLAKVSQISPEDVTILIERKRLDDLLMHLRNELTAEKEKKYPSALDCIEKCLLISPQCLAYKIRKAEYLILLKRHDEAQQILKEVQVKDSINVDAKYIMGLHIYVTNIAQAVPYFKSLLRLDPDHSKSLLIYKKAKRIMEMMLKGNEELELGHFAVAHHTYTMVLGIDPENLHIKRLCRYGQGKACLGLKAYERAIEKYSQALDIDPNYVRALQGRGLCYMMTHEYEEAIADFSRVCSLDPSIDCHKSIADAERLLASVKKDFHEILGVSRNPSIEEVKKAYLNKAKMHHPDRHADNTIEQRRKHERKFKCMTAAYRELLEKCQRQLLHKKEFH